ncbi:hypothetical protein COCSADRAFT_36572 [Bipolaris sorokiniana ND90Pr]|uniref:Zn(2)-C6 fungal-type domain-containing protein n=1 Tax=Cochliobolus sativus (strain ND90Pr / ATCC 201652) TaxID=665912 RepID=M2SD78_COCSN|nr:uncharacterized protein COCSADRAFT_36572 [Bipolaris sorokiniana ND90Pr]EMD65253.1 hypothetical protein COCSADRAFT_36572 [Bipolaris sorokiniana ND90Pr]
MVKTRRAHRKSRAGCRECKRRRIKCSEGKPSCTHCTRHHVSCVYDIAPGAPTQPASSEYSPTQSENLASPSGSPVRHTYKPSYIDLSHPQHLFDLKDMELLHHWNLVTSGSMVDSPSSAEIWRIHFPRVAFQHPYVMHSLLSIAALHVAYLNPSRRHSSIIDAGCHHAKALKGFHEVINHIGADNGDAVFATATLLFFHAFITLSQLQHDFDQQIGGCSRVSRILGAEWIPLLRGVGAVLPPVLEHVRMGPLSSMISLGNWEIISPNDNPTADDERLRDIGQLWKDDKHAEVYETSLHLLRQFWAWMVQLKNSGGNASGECGYHGIGSGPFMWLFIAPEKFFDLQRQRQPAALVLFAHFGALLQKLNGYWWAEGCGKSIVSAIDECLGSYWEPWTRWPKEVVGLI